MKLTQFMEYIEWRDCVSCGGWQNHKDMAGWGENRIITTIGFLAYESNKNIVIAQSIGDSGQGSLGCNWMSIPKETIIKRKKLKEKNT